MAVTRRLQTEVFWRDEYEVSDKDLDLITSTILEAGKPQRLSTLVAAIMMRRVQLEKEAAARRSKGILLYQPMTRYEVGQELTFSALDFTVGRVVAVRPGNNPKYPPFSVIKVSFGTEQPEREYAASFEQPHSLNRPVEELLETGGEEVNEADLVRSFEHYAARKIEPALEAHQDFVRYNGLWFIGELLPAIHVGYLNLAEAMIYEAHHPLAAREMIHDLELGATGSPEAQIFALNHALSQDARFDNVALPEEPIWYLRALEPEAAFAQPAVLKSAYRAVGGEYIGLTMLDMVDGAGDELDDVETAPTRETANVHYEVIFPHLYAGTMPATVQFLRLVGADAKVRMPITLVDGRSGQHFEGWVVPEAHYVCGLAEWYIQVEMCIGGQVSVNPLEAPRTFSLTVLPNKGKRGEWIRSASVVEDDLVIQMQRASVGVKCDRNMLIDIPDRPAIAGLMARAEESQLSLSALVRTAFEELSKLSSRGIVHAKSIYSVANLLRRTGCIPVFAELTRRAAYDPVGDGFWAYDPALEGVLYRTPEEMRERPQSRRDDLVRDQVTQYAGR